MAKARGRIRRIILWSVATLAGLVVALALAVVLLVHNLTASQTASFGKVEDEARQAQRTRESLPAAPEPFFALMDKGVLAAPAAGADYPDVIREVAADTGLAPEEVRQAAIRGQNTWMIWTGGNDRFWDFAARTAFGTFDLLKVLSSHPSQGYGRHNRWRYLGLVNEPCFRQADGPAPGRFGLWLDQRDPACPPDPFGGNAAADRAYPGVELRARGKTQKDGVTLPVGSFYGEPTGILGLRLFPNPDFDDKAAARWDPERFYTDPAYFNDKDLVRPFRVGMSCAFCHVGPNPVNPPKDAENPRLEELTSNPGAQYYWVDRIFFWNTAPRPAPGVPAANEGNFLYQLFHTNPPGALDTSLVSTDYMNNPRTMNAVYEVRARLALASRLGRERIAGDEAANRQFQDYPQTRAFSGLFNPAAGEVASMRVLKDGADSVGTLGALNRVYLNIGLFSEEWLLHFRPFAGGRKISPIRIPDAQRNSVYWNATEDRTADMAIFFLVTARADRLADVRPDAVPPPPADAAAATAALERGKVVFAQNCAACHSSKQPEPPASSGVDGGICAGGGAGPHYLECWNRFWSWAQSDAFKRGMVALATDQEKIDGEPFLKNNYLSTDRRVPLDLVRTNACTAIATNGLAGDIWDNFTSASYKALPPVGPVTVHHPVSGAPMALQPGGNGRGYLRPASLISLWSSAPYLSNNSVGHEDYYDRAAYAAPYPRPAPSTGNPDPTEPAEGAAAPSGAAYGSTGPAEPAYGRTGPGGPLEARPASGYGPDPRGRGAACPAADAADPDLPCVANRLSLFERSIRQMLSPETRRRDTLTREPVPGYIYRTTAPSCLIIPPGFVPDALRPFTGLLHKVAGWAVDADGGIHLGPFPSGFPVNALANTQFLPDNDAAKPWDHYRRLLAAGPGLLRAFAALGGTCTAKDLLDPAVDARAREVVTRTGLVDQLVGLSACPDFVVNGGHEFGADLPPEDKEALISFLRTF